MLILIEQVLKQYWYVSRCANNELAPCILKLKNNTEWKQTTVTEITENRFGNFRFWGENMLDRFGFFSFSSPAFYHCRSFAKQSREAQTERWQREGGSLSYGWRILQQVYVWCRHCRPKAYAVFYMSQGTEMVEVYILVLF